MRNPASRSATDAGCRDLLVKNLDWPGADELAERLKKTIPPELQDEEEQQIPPQVQQAMQQMEQAIKEREQMIQQLMQELQSPRRRKATTKKGRYRRQEG